MRRLYFILAALALPAGVATDHNATIGIMQCLLSSLFVLALIVALAWGLKKSRLVPQIGRKDFRVLFALPVGYKEKLIVVQAGDQQLLLGVTAQQISFLKEINPPLDLCTEPSAFAHHLSRWMNKPSSAEGEKND
jgi:flagellar protein FliO/FliZ